MRISDWSSDVCSSDLGLRAEDLREESLRRGVAVENAVLAAFLVIDDELHGDAGAAGPVGIRRRFAIAGEVARVVAGHHVLFETAPEGVVFRLQSPAANFSRPGRQATTTRSEERRVGKGGVRTGRSWGSQ